MTTTQRDDQWRHWLREHARAFVISGEPLWAEMLTVLADSGGPEDTGPITLTSQSDRARVPMTCTRRRRGLTGIAERVAAGPMTHEEVAQALNEMLADSRFANREGGDPR